MTFCVFASSLDSVEAIETTRDDTGVSEGVSEVEREVTSVCSQAAVQLIRLIRLEDTEIAPGNLRFDLAELRDR
jgi:hypothetical protein